MAAPSRQLSSAASAISSGVKGISGCCALVVRLPVVATEIMILSLFINISSYCRSHKSNFSRGQGGNTGLRRMFALPTLVKVHAAQHKGAENVRSQPRLYEHQSRQD